MENENFSKNNINNRFLAAVEQLLTSGIARNKATLAKAFDISPAKFTEIIGGRMKAGVDMIAILCNVYCVSPEWLLLNRGQMFRNKEDIPPINENPTTTQSKKTRYSISENDQQIERYLQMLRDKDETIIKQAEEIGRLKEHIAQDQLKNASAARVSDIADVG